MESKIFESITVDDRPGFIPVVPELCDKPAEMIIEPALGIELKNEHPDYFFIDQRNLIFKFQLINGSSKLANQIRTYLMHDIPVLALDTICTSKNESAFADPFVSNHIRLLPINADPRLYVPRNQCCLDGCVRCIAIFEIDVQCPAKEYLNVTSNSIKKNEAFYGNNAKLVRYILNDGTEMTTNKLTFLHDESSLTLQAVAEIGYGKNDAVYQCVSTVICIPIDKNTFNFEMRLTGSIERSILIEMLQEYISSVNEFRNSD